MAVRLERGTIHPLLLHLTDNESGAIHSSFIPFPTHTKQQSSFDKPQVKQQHIELAHMDPQQAPQQPPQNDAQQPPPLVVDALEVDDDPSAAVEALLLFTII